MYYRVKITWPILLVCCIEDGTNHFPGRRHQKLCCRRISLVGYQGRNSFKTRKSISVILWVDPTGKGNWCYLHKPGRHNQEKSDFVEWDRRWIQRRCNVCRCTEHGGSFSSWTFYECENWNPDVRKAGRETSTWVNIFTSWMEWHNS